MVHLHWILLFLKNFLDYETVNVWIQVLKRHKLNLAHPKRRSGVFRSKIDLSVAPKAMKVSAHFKNLVSHLLPNSWCNRPAWSEKSTENIKDFSRHIKP